MKLTGLGWLVLISVSFTVGVLSGPWVLVPA
jgi:hypothetical protein